MARTFGSIAKQLSGNETALVELLALKPLSDLPPLHRSIAEKLARRGMVRREGGTWHPTPAGLAQARRLSLH
jgi:hypothetical protein